MIKPTPNPPNDNPATKADRIPSAADIQATPRKPGTMFFVNPELDTETLLAHACESLASANVMTMDLADRTVGTSRNTLLGIATGHHAGGAGGESGAGSNQSA
jgi:hypothetical protein